MDAAIAAVLLRQFDLLTYIMFVTGFYCEDDDSLNSSKLIQMVLNVYSIYTIIKKFIETLFWLFSCVKLSYNLQLTKTKETDSEKDVSKKIK